MNDGLLKPGFWEQKNRNPLVGAIILIFLIGGIYFLFQSIVINLYVILDSMVSGGVDYSSTEGDYLEQLELLYQKHRFFFLAAVGISQFLILMGITLFVLPKWHMKDWKSYLRLDKFDLRGVLLGIISGIIIIPLVDWVSRLSFVVFPFLKDLAQTGSSLYQWNNPLEFLFVILIIGGSPAICEEILFRGYFQRTLQRKLKMPWPFIIAGVIFALYHQRLLSLPALMLVGIFIGFLFYRFDSLFVTMAFHFTYNSTLVILESSEVGILPVSLLSESGAFQNWVVLAALGILFILVLYIKISTRPKSPEEQNKSVIDRLEQADVLLGKDRKLDEAVVFHGATIVSDYPGLEFQETGSANSMAVKNSFPDNQNLLNKKDDDSFGEKGETSALPEDED